MASFKDYKPLTGDPTFSISIEFVNPEQWDNWLNSSQKFEEYYTTMFRECVFQIHKYLIRLTPLRSGRLRAGWTGILNRYNINYEAAFTDTTFLHRALINYDQKAIQEGMAMSQFQDNEYDVTIVNTVPYAEYLEFGTSRIDGQHFTNKARYKGEYVFEKELNDWFKEITFKGEVVKPEPVEEVVA